MSTRVTLKDVARACGCSVTAVSQVLRGVGNVSEGRRALISRMAAEMGYHRDSSAALLRSRRSSTGRGSDLPIAFLERADCSPQVPSPMVERVKACGASLGYRLETRRYRTHKELQTILRELEYRGVELLLLGNIAEDAWAPGVDWSPFVVLALWRFGLSYPFHTVRHNQFESLRKCFEYAYGRGYRRIGLVMLRHPEEILDDTTRFAAAMQVVRQYEGRVEPVPMFTYSDSLVAAEIRSWMSTHKPDAVVGFNHGVHVALEVAGYRVPQDVGFVNLQNCHRRTETTTKFCGCFFDRTEVALLVLRLGESFLRQNRRGMLTLLTETLVNPEFREGETLPPKEATKPLEALAR